MIFVSLGVGHQKLVFGGIEEGTTVYLEVCYFRLFPMKESEGTSFRISVIVHFS